MGLKIALQLYTVRDETTKDFAGTLEKVAAMGYTGVEFAGFGDIPASEMKKLLERLNLKAVASHTGMNLLENDLDEVIEYNKEIGNKYIVLPYHDFNSKEDYLKLAKKLNKIGKKLTENGMQLCYHNHSHEFEEFAGEYGLDILFANSDPDYLQTELDTCWIHAANLDPVDYVKKYDGRKPLVHIKDIKNLEDKELTEVGNGEVNVVGIVDACRNTDTEWLIVEQDSCEGSSLESAQISYNNLKEIL